MSLISSISHYTKMIIVMMVLFFVILPVSASSHDNGVAQLVSIFLPGIVVVIVFYLVYQFWWVPRTNIEDTQASLEKALIMTHSTDSSKRKQARTIFEQVLEGSPVSGELSLLAGLSISEYRMMELKLEPTENKIKQLETLFSKLDGLATDFRLDPYNFHLQLIIAKLKVMKGEKEEAVKYLERADLINSRASLDQDERLESEKNLILHNEDLNEAVKTDLSMKNRLKYVDLDDHIMELLEKLTTEIPGITSEVPVAFIIRNQEGKTLYSKKFLFGLIVDEQLYHGFETAIDSYWEQIASQNLASLTSEVDYIKYGQYTLVLKPEKNILLSYVIKGESSSAQQKISQLARSISSSDELWTGLTGNNGFTKEHKNQIESQIESVLFT